MELKRKLAQLCSSSIPGDIQKVFTDIAEDLFNKYHIEKNGLEYYFVDIEFYFCNKNYPDIITYPRELGEGRWFFHQSGIDLTFQSSYTRQYGKEGVVDATCDFAFGGILIRKLLKRSTRQVLDGPHKCEWELFDSFDAFTEAPREIPTIVRNVKDLSVTYSSSSRSFPYSDKDMERKYDALTRNTFHGPLLVSYDDFYRFINKDKLAYIADKESILKCLKILERAIPLRVEVIDYD